ncbi:Uncharacterised protein [Mycobacteroides abscessus subsp. abscessus]|uniref:hypothetical protein n=1 Tax=Mycobacteroides abscessus TaxID=36809 RepID=UPI00092C0FF7|nr:hypothetical protein [Mycobacteroides abscessus]SHT00352.1 Uncharacterised protein [Mycobacteroides abscessus subsp. abscessus]SHT24481.1 Uncharacterised protein [Mycobacteroides abscessus subsp. abscessus]SHT62192.1 Uncharacterised protein [Mycobacteroides abscessus subsp. abscessus]SHX77976.1 Uncharacterised protein [Mycobacteroides abscessus subsp. abscessus]SIB42628.1 Uncharacterised protein [Mycobacteroides abscessus subsp. abscessus]
MAPRIRDGENAGQTAAGVSALNPADAAATLYAIRRGQLDGVLPETVVGLLRAAAKKAAQEAQRRRFVLRLPDGEVLTRRAVKKAPTIQASGFDEVLCVTDSRFGCPVIVGRTVEGRLALARPLADDGWRQTPDGTWSHREATAEWRTDDEGRFAWIWAGGAPRVEWVEVAQ